MNGYAERRRLARGSWSSETETRARHERFLEQLEGLFLAHPLASAILQAVNLLVRVTRASFGHLHLLGAREILPAQQQALIDQALAERRTIMDLDVVFAGGPTRAPTIRMAMCSSVGIGTPIGALLLDRNVGGFRIDHRELLELLAHQIAIVADRMTCSPEVLSLADDLRGLRDRQARSAPV